MQYSQILWATLFGILLFDEIPDTLTLVGAGIIIASGIYIVMREGVADTSENTPVLQNRSRFETGDDPAHQPVSAFAERQGQRTALTPCQTRPEGLSRPPRSECSAAW